MAAHRRMTLDEAVEHFREVYAKNPPAPLSDEQVRVIREVFDFQRPAPAPARAEQTGGTEWSFREAIAYSRAVAWDHAATDPEGARVWLRDLWTAEDRHMRERGARHRDRGADA